MVVLGAATKRSRDPNSDVPANYDGMSVRSDVFPHWDLQLQQLYEQLVSLVIVDVNTILSQATVPQLKVQLSPPPPPLLSLP